jgi:hypothetical protein
MRRAYRLLAGRRLPAGWLAGLLAAGALPVTGCAQSVDPIERLGRKAAQHSPGPRTVVGAGGPGSDVHRRWGLAGPLAATPKPPARRLSAPYGGNHVPTRDKVVFLICDERAVRDPQFVRMTTELKLPVSVARTAGGPEPVPGRAYTKRMRLRPGDIVRAEPATLARLLRRVQEQGYAVAELEDYV